MFKALLSLLFVLFLCTCDPAKLQAQPRTDPLRVVNDITPRTDELNQRFIDLLKVNGEAATLANDSLKLTLLGEYVTPSYLVDRRGKVWNLGVMDLPFLVHTLIAGIHMSDFYQEAINSVAEQYADDLVIFLLLPTPTTDEGRAIIDGFNEHVVVVYDDQISKRASWKSDTRLLGLVGYNITHYISSERKILGVANAYIHPRRGTKTVLKKWKSDPVKNFIKLVELLLVD